LSIDRREAERRLAPVAEAYGTNARWLRVRTADYFGTLDFAGKQVLDIGAGKGLYACCVASLNAERVVALEPELAGSRNTTIDTFQQKIEKLCLHNLEFHPITMQSYEAPPASFDIVYMLAVINHLDETQVETLDRKEESRVVFRQLLQPVYNWLKPGGTLVVTDISNTHAYIPLMKLGLLKQHPFHKTIEWEKHQPPQVWKSLLESAGFSAVQYHWATNWRYPQIPRFLCDNVVAAQLYSPLFVLHAHKPSSSNPNS
jgi:2-polyprenyl-3-methyl-5-hydroxy-6-metoxy-1,4-benzoquinol methylase